MKSVPDTTPETRTNETAPASALVFVVFLFGALLFLGGLYLDKNAGHFNSKVYAPFTSEKELAALKPQVAVPPWFAKGKEVYGRTCNGCHQANGMGMAGQFPPLVGSEWVVGTGPNRMVRIVLHGLQGPISVKGGEYNNAMIAWKDVLNDEEIAAVVSYVRNEWGNKDSVVTAAQVKKIRDETADRGGAWTAPELLKVADKD